MAQPTLAPPNATPSATPPVLSQWQLRELPTGRQQAYIPVGEVFAGAAQLDIVLEPDEPGVGWPKVCVISRSRSGTVHRLIIAAVDELDIDLDAAITSAKAQAAEMILDPIGDVGVVGLDQLTDEQIHFMCWAPVALTGGEQ
ncbi:hypothetical protein FZ103_00640 [Streptomonospora sp. PA3]|uniref:hypothetical protein n=1 Tax=Streptomonospora sp. PA3 TaxID=2607326 RepID=UPI0012DE4B47|nr:hypothetical protein [Streptomonospora sp. PA3]MUL39699.1 hypothetical protein [Streptomonospora sp. PA3]